MIAGFAAVLLLGILIGWGAGKIMNRTEVSDKAPPVGQQQAGDKRDEAANAIATADPQASETSPRTVIEDESFGPAVPSEQMSALPSIPESSSHEPPHGRPNWEKYALSAINTGGRPMIAVIIDDMGVDKRRSEKILQLPGPLTVSFMSYAEELGRQTEEAHGRGHELMMHVPMEPLADGIDAGPGVLSVNLPAEELKKRVDDDLDRFRGYVGINNHMGSKFTAYAPGMQVLMAELHRRGLLFVDSLTTDHSVGLALAQQSGVPTVARNVFLDNVGEVAAVEGQLIKLEELARKKGSAVAIGHPRDATIAALNAWLPSLREKGLVLVPISQVVSARQAMAASH
jgi:hypothetical protein